MNAIKILLVGANGQLGYELTRTVPEAVQLKAFDKSGLDITELSKVQEQVGNSRPDWVINAAAYTAVDKAEEESDLAYRVNRDGAANLASVAKQVGARMIHISTDFVFDGNKSSPYKVDDEPSPQSVYGASKQAGEQVVLDILADDVTIIRTAWVYSSHGQNFVKTMLRLMSEREELGVVADQIGTPTWANGLARMIWQAIDKGVSGIYHWADSGIASWYDFAVAIYEESKVLGLLPADKLCRIRPIRTEDYPLPARRPAYGLLDKTDTWKTLSIQPNHWRIALREMLRELQ